MMHRHIYEVIKSHCERHHSKAAVLATDHSATYGEVVAMADGVAQVLSGAGLKDEQPVAVYMQRNAKLLGVLLGIMKAGGAYLPIDLQDPPDRVMTMLQIAGCNLVIGDHENCSKLPGWGECGPSPALRFLEVRHIEPVPDCQDVCASGGARLAYLIFTSGSTGAPKAVEIEHRSMMNVLIAARDLLKLTENDCFLGVTTLAFDISVAELFLPLMVGGSLVLRDKTTLLDPPGMARLVRDENITVIHTGPSVWAVILEQVPDFPKIRIAISAGEAISPSISRRLSAYGDVAWNMYGPTEATVWATGQVLTAEIQTDENAASAPIGLPFAGVDVLIEDQAGKPVKDGQNGELLLGGICVARGYRGRPDLTAERFVMRGDIRFYRTGDIVRRNPDGTLEYLGRVDDQISIQGRRVEPREIEVVLERQPDISHAAATWFETETGSRAIVCAIVPKDGRTPDNANLRKNLAQVFPEAMIPAKIVLLERLPTNKNAKVDRPAIRSMASRIDDQISSAQSGQMTPTEELVSQMWKRAMRMTDVSNDANFFAIGGDSLAAVTLNLELEQKLGIQLPPQLVLETPVLQDFAGRIDEVKARKFVQSETSYIFPLHERPGSTPVFFCGVDLTMARHWTQPFSLYAIAYWAGGGNLVEIDTIEGLAARYIEGMKEFQPSGPYRMAGYSFGAILALEIAQQLRASGETVETLFLLDPFQIFHTVDANDGQVIMHGSTRPSFSTRLKKYARDSMASVRRDGLRGVLASLYKPVEKFKGGPWLAYQLHHLHARRPDLVSERFLPRSMWPVFWYAARKKAAEYTARPYTGRAVMVITPKQGGENAWQKVLGPACHVEKLQASHRSLFNADVAERWQSILGRGLSPTNEPSREISDHKE